ncbi:MAG TPA: response regulator [Chloroflexaceae bacterium]|nr:response regulator [Chloroflexaceae bacterium]
MESGIILLVDDNPQILSILADLLRPLGHKVQCASSGIAALELAAADPPDLILLDVMMPGLDGFGVCRRIRAHPLLAQVPVILVTALDDRESRVRGFEAGADEFVAKPFDYVELRARVSTILRLNRYRKLLEQQHRVAAERARFVWAVEHSDDGILVLGPDDQARYANPRARQILGLAADDPLSAPFISIAAARYTLTPPEAWSGWPVAPAEDETPRFLVTPEGPSTAERWLRVDLLPPTQNDDARVLRLRDVTEQITSQREMWTFHAMLGHKLRTPLVGILGGLNILNGGASSMDRQSIARITEVALAAARRLRSEIEDILHYLRPPANLYGAEGPTVGELAALAEQVAADMGIGRLTLAVEPALAGRRVALTRQGMEVALREVIENSIKFHPQHDPRLQITVNAAGAHQIALAIGDDGPGLMPHQIPHVWRPYYQGERNFTGQVDGMGLGLALVARIIHAVGGHYELRNRDDGRGALVTLTIPLAEG